MENAHGETELAFTAELARQTGELLNEYFQRSGLQTRYKADHTLVTEADLAADRLIAAAIAERFPNDRLLSEELQPDLSPSDEDSGIWVIDPLDGTTNFSLGMHYWGVSIARLTAGWPQAAALYFPPINEVFTAQRGRGAFLNGQRLQVEAPDENRPSAFFSCCSRTFRKYEVRIPYKSRILGSAAYSLCAVARNLALVSFEATPKIWDIAAAWLVVQEAGGAIEALEGPSPFPLHGYARSSFPTLAAATQELLEQSRQQIRRRK